MTDEQSIHVTGIEERMSDRIVAKYAKGAAEHGGNVWDHDELWLIEAALDEVADLATYLETLKEKIKEKRSAAN